MAILVVDDEDEICVLLRDAFEHRGHQVDVAHTGEEALDRLRQQYYDVAVLDLVMPGIGGSGVLESRDSFPYTSIIVLTAYGSKETAVLALRQDADDYLDKPILPSKVVDVVEGFISQYEMDGFIVDMVVRTGYYQGEALDLTPEMFNLFAPFIRHPNKIFTYQDLAFIVVGKEMEQEKAMQYLKAQMSRLRQRLEEQTGRTVIRRGQYGPGRHVEFSYFHDKPRNS